MSPVTGIDAAINASSSGGTAGLATMGGEPAEMKIAAVMPSGRRGGDPSLNGARDPYPALLIAVSRLMRTCSKNCSVVIQG